MPMPKKDPKDYRHGTYTTYCRRKCRCQLCKDAANVYRTKYRDTNRSAVQARQKRFYDNNPNYTNNWRRANREIVLGYWASRRLRVRLSKEDRSISAEYRKAIKSDPCYYCGYAFEIMHDDHFFPLAKGGTDHWWNLVRSCSNCNLTKSNRCGTRFKLVKGVTQIQIPTEQRNHHSQRILGG